MKANLMGYVRRLSENVEETRTIEFVATDNTRDGHKSVLPIDKWDLERFDNNGIIGYQHNVYGDLCGNDDPDKVIGKGQARIENDKMIVAITFEPSDLNPLAEKIFRKIRFGSLNAVSVGFTETKPGHWGEGDEARDGVRPTYYYDGQELLEVSVVNIPSNKNALKRGFRDNTVDAINFIYRALDGCFRYSEIEDMKVRDILDLLEERKESEKTESQEEPKTIGMGTEEVPVANDDIILAEAELMIDK